MKNILFLLLFIQITNESLSQIQVSKLPTTSGDVRNGYVPIVINGVTAKVLAKKLGRLDSISVSQGVSYDTLFVWYSGVKIYYKLIRAGSGVGSMTYPSSIGLAYYNGTAWGASIIDNSGNWNAAYSWGNHAGLYPTITRFGDSLIAIRAALNLKVSQSIFDDSMAVHNTKINSKQPIITLTAIGTGGNATFAGNVLNIPAYQSAYANLTAIGSFPNGVGFLKNNGIGSFSYVMPTWTDVTSKPSTFTPSLHYHPLGELLQSGATIGQVPKWNGTNFAPADDNTGGGGGIPADSSALYSNRNIYLQAQLDSLGDLIIDSSLDKLATGTTDNVKIKSIGFGSSSTVAASKVITDSTVYYTFNVIDGSVTNAKAATMPQHSFKGNKLGSTAAPTDLTIAEMQAELSIVTLAMFNGYHAATTDYTVTANDYFIDLKEDFTEPSFTKTLVLGTASSNTGKKLIVRNYSNGMIWEFNPTVKDSKTNQTITSIPLYSELVSDGTNWIINRDSTGTGGTGIASLNSQTGSAQTFATGTSGTDFGISSSGDVHTFNIPTSSSSNRGLLSPTNHIKLFNFQSATIGTGTVTHDGNAGAQDKWLLSATGARTLAFSNMGSGYQCVFYFDNTSGATIALTLPSNSYVQNSSGVYASASSVTIPTGKTTMSLAFFDGTNYWFITSF